MDYQINLPTPVKIIEALNYYNRNDLASLLRSSTFNTDTSSTYGSRYCSLITSMYFFTDIRKNEKLKKLSEEDITVILNAVHVVYPVIDREIEINNLEFHIDPELTIPANTVSKRRIQDIDFDYIHEQIKKCDEKLLTHDFEGAVTNSRTLLESILKYILEKGHISYDDSENVPKLFKKVSEYLGMDPKQYESQALKKIISGSFNIIQGLNEIRNDYSDAHGKSPNKKYKINERHTVLCVEITKSLTNFLYSSFMDKENNQTTAST